MQPQNNGYYGGSPVSYASPKRGPSKRAIALIVLTILVLLSVVLGVISASGGGSSKGKSESLIELIQQNNGVDSYKLLTEQTQNSVSSEEWVSEVVALNTVIKDKEPKVFYTKELDDVTTEIAYNFGEPGSVYQLRIVVDKESGLIQGISHNPTTL